MQFPKFEADKAIAVASLLPIDRDEYMRAEEEVGSNTSSMVAAVVGVRLGIVELASLVVRVLGGGLPLVQGGRT